MYRIRVPGFNLNVSQHVLPGMQADTTCRRPRRGCWYRPAARAGGQTPSASWRAASSSRSRWISNARVSPDAPSATKLGSFGRAGRSAGSPSASSAITSSIVTRDGSPRLRADGAPREEIDRHGHASSVRGSSRHVPRTPPRCHVTSRGSPSHRARRLPAVRRAAPRHRDDSVGAAAWEHPPPACIGWWPTVRTSPVVIYA